MVLNAEVCGSRAPQRAVADAQPKTASAVASATRMAAQLGTARCIFDSLWFELTSLDTASHGPPKAPSCPVAWSENSLRQAACQNCFAKCNCKAQKTGQCS